MTTSIPDYDAKFIAPFATIGIRADKEFVTEIRFLSAQLAAKAPPTNSLAQLVCVQLMSYLNNPKFKFDLPIKLSGSHHQVQVWQAMCRIPAGETRSYGDIATEIHSAPRAIGGACGKNPLPIVVPCHRIVGANGLGGFMGGKRDDPLAIKRWLLTHEGAL